jgi:hypothetical protein
LGKNLGNTKQVIEINGKRYDAATGQLLNSATPKPASSKPPKPAAGVALDGFVRRSNTIQPKSSRPTQRSKTLMRSAAKKPTIKNEKLASELAKPKIARPHEARAKRANSAEKSHRISRFHKKETVSGQIVKKTAELPVVKQVQQGPVQSTVAQFERAMHEATSHLQDFAPKKNKRSRKLLYGSGALVTVFAVGFLAWQTVPAVKVKFAGSQAGFSASLPNYNPAGYGLNNDVKATSGEVTLNYQSRTDDKNYKIIQAPSNWTSQTLLTNFVLPANKPYQTYQDQGKTIYIYDNSNATWVDGGIWYRLEGNASLTSDQLLRIANGL